MIRIYEKYLCSEFGLYFYYMSRLKHIAISLKKPFHKLQIYRLRAHWKYQKKSKNEKSIEIQCLPRIWNTFKRDFFAREELPLLPMLPLLPLLSLLPLLFVYFPHSAKYFYVITDDCGRLHSKLIKLVFPQEMKECWLLARRENKGS